MQDETVLEQVDLMLTDELFSEEKLDRELEQFLQMSDEKIDMYKGHLDKYLENPTDDFL